jgi:pimeloyl-ACP methyl ester carboxylesterase
LQAGGYDLLLDTMMPYVLSDSYFSNPLIPIDQLKNIRKEINQNREALLKLMQATKERYDYLSELKKITTPTVIIHGEKDLLMPVAMANEVHLCIKDSVFIIIPNTGHTLNLENFQLVSQRILEYAT